MKLLWCIVLLSPVLLLGQGTNTAIPPVNPVLTEYLREFTNVTENAVPSTEISNFVEKLQARDLPKSNFRFCKTLFQKTRQQFFKRYSQYASFAETLTDGKYNCLTGTALYALLLDHFGIEYKIIETNYHIFLLAMTDEGTVLFEATDPTHGFVTDPKKIEQQVQAYKRNDFGETRNDGKSYYSYAASLYQPVSVTELRGLLHYNVSVEAYNRQDFNSAITNLDKALELYNSSRISEFTAVLMKAVLESNLDDSRKAVYLDRIQTLREKLPVMANSGGKN
jgi:hypothetical protein